MNVKESHLLAKNKLLQQEIFNSDSQQVHQAISDYGRMHSIIFDQEAERMILKDLMNRILKARNG